MHGGTRVVTVEADLELVESRLVSGGGRVPGVPGCVTSVGMGAPPCGLGPGGGPAAASRAMFWVPGNPCVVAGHGVAAARVRRRADRGGVGGPCRWVRASDDRRPAWGAGGDGAWLVAGDGHPAGLGAGVVAAGGAAGWGGSAGAQDPGLWVAGSAGRVGGGAHGGHRPVRAGGGPGPGDGVAAGFGVFGRSAPCSALATDAAGWGSNTSRL